jgi:integrase
VQAQLVKRTSSGSKQPTFKKVGECLYRYLPNGKYYAWLKRGGKQKRQSLKTTDRQLAERRLLELQIKLERARTLKRDRGTTFMELAKDWFDAAKTRMKPSSARGTDVCRKQLNKHYGAFPVRNITTAVCHEWEKKRGSNISASTFNHDRTVLIAVLDFAVGEGLLLENPARSIARRKLPKNRIVITTPEQFSLLVKTIRSADCRARNAGNLVELLAYSGMRLSEATALTWGDVDFERGQFTVTGGLKGTKNHEVRCVPLFPAMRSLLEHIKSERKSNVGFDERIIPTGHARKAIETACKKALLPHFHHHLFRHFFVSQAIEAGVDFKTIAAWVGHKDGGVLVAKTYGHLRDVHSFEMAKKMTFSASSQAQPKPANIIELQPPNDCQPPTPA